MAIARVGNRGTAYKATSGTQVCNYGQAPTAGNILIMGVTVGDGSSVTTPAGWTLAHSGNKAAGQSVLFRIYWKVAAGGDAAPSIVVDAAGYGLYICIEEWSGLDTSAPVVSTVGSLNPASTGQVVISSTITPVAANSLVYSFAGHVLSALKTSSWSGGSTKGGSAYGSMIQFDTGYHLTTSIASYSPTITLASDTSTSYVNIIGSVAFREKQSIPVAYTATVATSLSTMVDPIVNPNFGRINFPAPVATLSAAMPSAVITVQRSNTYVASAATLSAVMVDGRKVKSVTATIAYDRGQNASVGPDAAQLYFGGTYASGLFQPNLSLPSDASVYSAYLRVRLYNGDGNAVETHQITGAWTEADFSGVTLGAANSSLIVGATDQFYSLDVKNIVAAWVAGAPNYGIALVTSTSMNAWTSEGGASAPYLVVEYTSFGNTTISPAPATSSNVMADPTVVGGANVNFSQTPATESHLMVSPAISTTRGVNYGATAETSTAIMVDPTIYAVHPFDFAAVAFTATADMLNGVFALPVTVPASVAAGSHLMTDAVIMAEDNAKILAARFIGSALLISPIEAQGATNDPYYNRLASTTDTNDYWYRLDEMAGATLADARADALKTAALAGTYNFGLFGPESRKAMHFDSGYFTPSVVDGGTTSEFAFEVVLRTTDPDGLLINSTNGSVSSPVNQGIYLKDGKVTVTSTGNASQPQYGLGSYVPQAVHFNLTGIKNVADGEWHHIVVAYREGPNVNAFGEQVGDPWMLKNLDTGLRIYIDGKLDRRKSIIQGSGLPRAWYNPDSYFGMANHSQSILGSHRWVAGVPSTSGIITGDNVAHWVPVYDTYMWPKNFTGDVMEVVFRNGSGYTQDAFAGLYYDTFGIVPIYAGAPATSSGFMTDSNGKGNKRRVLVLWRNLEWAGLNQNAVGGYEPISGGPPEDFDHAITVGFYQDIEPKDFNNMDIIQMPYVGGHGVTPYRDAITDVPRLINLQEDVDMSYVDLIVFRNWPDEGSETALFSALGYGPKELDDFVASVKQAVVDGCGLEVTSPSLALRLGLISGATPVPTLYEAGTVLREKDARSAAIDPWGEGGSVTPRPTLMPALAGPDTASAPSGGMSFAESVVEIIPETPVEGMPLGRHVNHDPRSWNYAFTATPQIILKPRKWIRVTSIMDQGIGQGFGSCTGFAAVGTLGTTPLYATVSSQILDSALAVKVYSEATLIDPFPWTFPPDDFGSDTLSVAKVLKAMGLISRYEWAFTIEDALAALQSGPVMTGIPWYQGFDYPDPKGFVSISGQIRGGHAVSVVEINVEKNTVTCANSWGTSWGNGGFFTMSWATWSTLLSQGGDVTVLFPRDPWVERVDVAAENNYVDTHGNNIHRVVTEVPDLTDIPSSFMADSILAGNATNGTDGKDLNVWSYKLADRTDGLVIGDTMHDVTQFWNKVYVNLEYNTPSGYQWNKFMWAVNPDGLTAGIPVYRFAETIWNGNIAVPNPYAQYIGGAVVRPGDTWGGVRIAGKVWMNFAEWPFDATPGSGGGGRGYLMRQIVPPNNVVAAMGNSLETEAMRLWDYSQHRVISVANTAAGGRELTLTYDRQGKPMYVYRRNPLATAPSEFEKYPVEGAIVLTWTHRGLAWLGAREVVVEGSATDRPLAMQSTGAFVNPVVVAEHGVTVSAAPSQGVGVMNSPDEIVDVDAVVLVFAAEANGYMTGYGKVIYADPFLASGEIVDNFNMVKATGEEVVLYLSNDNQIDLYLKEDK